MTGILLGVTMLVSSATTVPALNTSHMAAPSIFRSDVQPETLLDWRHQPARRRLAASVKAKSSKVDRIIAIAAGVSIGWVTGGAIGFAVTPKRGPYDDTSGLRGMIIGAPIGAVAGALLGYRLTK